MTNNVQLKIKQVSLKFFSENGFYGTSIRDIAKEVGCSLPTVYYYFKNKEELFEELAYHEFLSLNQRLQGEITLEDDIENMYIQSVIQRLHLEGYDRLTYILAQKASLGLDGNLEVTNKIRTWEKERFQNAHFLLEKYYGIKDIVYGNILSRVSSNIILKGLVYNENFTDQEIKEEIETLFRMIRSENE